MACDLIGKLNTRDGTEMAAGVVFCQQKLRRTTIDIIRD